MIVPEVPQPAVGAPEPATEPALRAPEPTITYVRPIRVRMERTLPDGRTEEVEISEVYIKGHIWKGSALKDGSIKVAPGWIVNVTTSDPLVPVPTFRLKVPDAVPQELVFRVPSRDDPAIQTVSLQVVDAVTGQPLGDAVFEFEDPAVSPLHADNDGRIQFHPVRDLFGRPASGLVRWLVESGTIHARGHLSFVPRLRLGGGRPEGVPGIELADLDAARRSPVVRVPLRPIPQGASERRLRLRYADGGSTEGLLVAVWGAVPCAQMAAVGRDAMDGIRRVGPSGEIAFPMETVVGFDVWKGGLPMVSLHLHADRWPPSGARELRLPPIAEVEVEIEEAPDGEEGYWSDADDWGALIADGPVHPVESDPEARAHLEARSLCVGTGLVGVGGSLAPKHGTVRFSLPVGSKRTLHLVYNEVRRLDLAPEKPGPLRIRTRWADLPKR